MSQEIEAEMKVRTLYNAYKGAIRRGKTKNYKNDKDWHLFVKTIDTLGREEDFDPYSYGKFLGFNGYYPGQFASYKTYKEYRDSKIGGTKKETVKLLETVVAEYKSILSIMRSKKIENLQEALEDDFCLMMIERNKYNRIFLMFSKKYTQCKVPTETILKKIILLKNEKIKKFLQDTLQDDFYIDDVKKYFCVTL